jgi:hypothetical protein
VRPGINAGEGNEKVNGRPVTLEEACISLRVPNRRMLPIRPYAAPGSERAQSLVNGAWVGAVCATPARAPIYPSIHPQRKPAGTLGLSYPLFRLVLSARVRPPHIGSLHQQQHPADVQRAWTRKRAGLGRLRSEAACGSERYSCGMECGLQMRTSDRMTAVTGSRQRNETKRNGERHKLDYKKQRGMGKWDVRPEYEERRNAVDELIFTHARTLHVILTRSQLLVSCTFALAATRVPPAASLSPTSGPPLPLSHGQ